MWAEAIGLAPLKDTFFSTHVQKMFEIRIQYT